MTLKAISIGVALLLGGYALSYFSESRSTIRNLDFDKTSEPVKQETLNPSKDNEQVERLQNAPKKVANEDEIPFALRNKTSRETAQSSLEKGQYFMALVAEVEGFRSSFYPDNKGFAIGFGYNATMQSPQTSIEIGQEALGDLDRAKTLASISNRYSLPKRPDIEVTPDEAARMAQALTTRVFEPSARQWLPVFDDLLPHEQATVKYHFYKTGPVGGAKYTTLKQNLIELVNNRTPEQIKKVASGFAYSYEINGERKQDTRASMYMQAMFTDPEIFGDMIKGKRNDAIAKLPAYAFANIDASNPATYDSISDPYGISKSRAESSTIRDLRAMSRIITMGGF